MLNAPEVRYKPCDCGKVLSINVIRSYNNSAPAEVSTSFTYYEEGKTTEERTISFYKGGKCKRKRYYSTYRRLYRGYVFCLNCDRRHQIRTFKE